LQQATRAIPIVFADIGDPVGQGFVVGLARPGGNITGFTGFEFSLGGKWVGFLRELAPSVTRIAYLFHPEITAPYYALWVKSVEAAAANSGVETIAAPVRTVADIERAISAIAVHPDGGLIVLPDAYELANRRLIIELAARYGLPAVYPSRYHALEGGLVCYGPDGRDLYRRAADYIDRILKGEKPAEPAAQEDALKAFVGATLPRSTRQVGSPRGTRGKGIGLADRPVVPADGNPIRHVAEGWNFFDLDRSALLFPERNRVEALYMLGAGAAPALRASAREISG
jgi:putative ABC transport system substrate-binding protein